MKRLGLAAVSVLLLAGCATVSDRPPAERIQDDRLHPSAYEGLKLPAEVVKEPFPTDVASAWVMSRVCSPEIDALPDLRLEHYRGRRGLGLEALAQAVSEVSDGGSAADAKTIPALEFAALIQLSPQLKASTRTWSRGAVVSENMDVFEPSKLFPAIVAPCPQKVISDQERSRLEVFADIEGLASGEGTITRRLPQAALRFSQLHDGLAQIRHPDSMMGYRYSQPSSPVRYGQISTWLLGKGRILHLAVEPVAAPPQGDSPVDIAGRVRLWVREPNIPAP